MRLMYFTPLCICQHSEVEAHMKYTFIFQRYDDYDENDSWQQRYEA
jgi:hypothetical protein